MQTMPTFVYLAPLTLFFLIGPASATIETLIHNALESLAFRQAEANKDWVIGYFYEPQWFMSEVPLVKVDLPPYEEAATRTQRRSRATTPSTSSTRS